MPVRVMFLKGYPYPNLKKVCLESVSSIPLNLITILLIFYFAFLLEFLTNI